MARMRDRLEVPVMCGVGAAFDFHAGPHLDGAALDAGPRPRVGLPDRPGAEAPAAALPHTNPRFVVAFARQYLAERAPAA